MRIAHITDDLLEIAAPPDTSIIVLLESVTGGIDVERLVLLLQMVE